MHFMRFTLCLITPCNSRPGKTAYAQLTYRALSTISVLGMVRSRPRYVLWSPPRRMLRADCPHCALPFASPQALWDLSCWATFCLAGEPWSRCTAAETTQSLAKLEALAAACYRKVSHPTAKHWIPVNPRLWHQPISFRQFNSDSLSSSRSITPIGPAVLPTQDPIAD
jgi:hypothetical protein